MFFEKPLCKSKSTGSFYGSLPATTYILMDYFPIQLIQWEHNDLGGSKYAVKIPLQLTGTIGAEQVVRMNVDRNDQIKRLHSQKQAHFF